MLKIMDECGADFLILENCDACAFLHNNCTQLAVLTGFAGSAGEAVMSADGHIYLFVDPRYHIQADVQASDDVEIVKVPAGSTFLNSIKEIIPKSAKIIMDIDILYAKFQKFAQNFALVDVVELPKGKNVYANGAGKCAQWQVPLEISGVSEEEKIAKIRKFIAKKGAKSLFVSGLEDIAYLTNRRGCDFEFSSVYKTDKMLIECAGADIDSEGGATKGATLFDPNTTTVRDFRMLKNPVALKKNPIQEMMSIKNNSELTHMKSCFSRLDKALTEFKAQIRPGLCEFELKEIFEREAFNAGAKSIAFKTILAIGENSASIHYSSYDKEKRLKNGDLVLIDCGAYYEGGYATDITRVFVCGEPNGKSAREQKKVYTLVLKAFLMAYNCEAALAAEVDKAAREFLNETAPKGFAFSHSLGHGIGISVHQSPPTLSSKSKGRLKKGMVFSIEPGLYCEGKFGVRLENCVYIDKNGKKQTLSHFEFERKLIDEKMLNKYEKEWLKEWLN